MYRNVGPRSGGGLDSLCGDILAGNRACRVVLGHWDSPATKRAQNRAHAWLEDASGEEIPYEQIRVVQTGAKKEASTRTRSLLFIGLGVAAAIARDARTLEVPENGFTSLNPPLGADRGGALSTRSTHPRTFELINQVLQAVDLDVTVVNPLGSLTKGEVVRAASDTGIDGLEQGVATTLSCGKLDGRLYSGGNPNHHCGLCVPCLVRRGSILAAGIDDATEYLHKELRGRALRRLIKNRSDDIAAVRVAVRRGASESELLALGPFPRNFDFDLGFELWEEGLAELASVELP